MYCAADEIRIRFSNDGQNLKKSIIEVYKNWLKMVKKSPCTYTPTSIIKIIIIRIIQNAYCAAAETIMTLIVIRSAEHARGIILL